VNHHEYAKNASGREPLSSSLRTGHHKLGSGSATAVGHNGSSATRGGDKLRSCEEKVEGTVEVHGAGREKREMEWQREMESTGKKKKEKRGSHFEP